MQLLLIGTRGVVLSVYLDVYLHACLRVYVFRYRLHVVCCMLCIITTVAATSLHEDSYSCPSVVLICCLAFCLAAGAVATSALLSAQAASVSCHVSQVMRRGSRERVVVTSLAALAETPDLLQDLCPHFIVMYDSEPGAAGARLIAVAACCVNTVVERW